MQRLLALARKEFLQLRRDTITLRMIVMVPLLQTMIFGYAINYDVKHLKTVVLDEDTSYESRELVAKMTASEYFDVVKHVGLRGRAAPRDRLRARVRRPRDRPRLRQGPAPRRAREGPPRRERLGHDDGEPGDGDRRRHLEPALAPDARRAGGLEGVRACPSTCA